jgi:glc operon protein GlcG
VQNKTTPLEYGPPISLASAKQVAAAAEAEATANGWPIVFAIVDSGGNLVLLHKLDNTQHGSIEIAQAKALTAVNFKRPTKAFEEGLAAGGAALRLLKAPGILPMEGGVPLIQNGKVIGAIGVSGVAPQNDAQVAGAGAKVLG